MEENKQTNMTIILFLIAIGLTFWAGYLLGEKKESDRHEILTRELKDKVLQINERIKLTENPYKPNPNPNDFNN